jgi:hypothetical protein
MQEFEAYPASRPDGLRMRSTILALFAVVMASYAAAMLLVAETSTNPQANKGKSGMAGIFSFRPSSVIHFRIQETEMKENRI